MEIEQKETRICLVTAIVIMLYGLHLVNENRREIAQAHDRNSARCAVAALHKINAVGKWDDDIEECVVRMRTELRDGPDTTVYDEDVSLDQLPPPSI